MPEALTLEHFDETMAAIADTLSDHTQRFNTIEATLADHTKRLDRIEQLLWHGERLAEVERRVIKLAEFAGAADLATPFTTPIGI